MHRVLVLTFDCIYFFYLVLSQRLIASKVWPAISPTKPGRKIGGATDSNTGLHQPRDTWLSHRSYAGLQFLIRHHAILVGTAFPVSVVMGNTARQP